MGSSTLYSHDRPNEITEKTISTIVQMPNLYQMLKVNDS